MKPAPFRYHAPKTVDEAVGDARRGCGEDGRVLAGGQSLVPIMAFRLARPGPPGRHQRRRGAARGWRSTATSSASAPACAMPPSTSRWWTGRSGGSSPRSCVTSRTIRSARAARSAAASRMPIRPPNGAWSPRRSAPRWWRRRAGGTRTIAAQDFFRGIMTTALQEDELLTRSAAADPARRHALRLLRVQSPRRRFRARHGAGHLSPRRTA